jgi:transposase
MYKKINAYPLFFKLRVIKYYYDNQDIHISKILVIFNISNGTLYNWLRLYNNNSLTEKKNYTKKSIISPSIKMFIMTYVLRKIHFNYRSLIIAIKRKFNLIISKSTIYSILDKMNITHKKIKYRYILNNKVKHNIKVRSFIRSIKPINLDNIISIDECSVDTHMNASYGWSNKGNKLNVKKIIGQKQRFTIICAISNNKVLYYECIKGSSTAIIFKNFICNLINANHIQNKVFLLDNASIHRSILLKEYINTTNCKLLFNAPYSPEYNPIEKVFSKIKPLIANKNNNHSVIKFKRNINLAIKKIKKSDLCNFFTSSLTFK